MSYLDRNYKDKVFNDNATGFNFHVPKSLGTKFGRNGQVFLRKTCFNFHT